MNTFLVLLAWFGLLNGLGAAVTLLLLLNRTLRPVNEIRRLADDILDAGLGIARNLDGVDEALRTRELAQRLPRSARTALDRVAGGRR